MKDVLCGIFFIKIFKDPWGLGFRGQRTAPAASPMNGATWGRPEVQMLKRRQKTAKDAQQGLWGRGGGGFCRDGPLFQSQKPAEDCGFQGLGEKEWRI